jgi:hypothetical protein
MSLQEPGKRRFTRNSNIADFIRAMEFERYPLFLVGLAYDMNGNAMRANAVATRDGDIVAFDSGYGLELDGRTPFPEILHTADAAALDGLGRVSALGRLNLAYLSHEFADHTLGFLSINELAIRLLGTWFNKDTDWRPIGQADVLGAWPVEITWAMTDAIQVAAKDHDPEQAARLLDYVSKPADTES